LALIFDTGPLVASLDADDARHGVSRTLIEEATESLVIPAPVLVEVAYFTEQRLAPKDLVAFLDDLATGRYVVENLLLEDYARAAELCEQYADARVGFVDAAVLSVVERLGEPKLATLDHRHFGLLRPRHVEALELIPEL
jgi:hypothetical protein